MLAQFAKVALLAAILAGTGCVYYDHDHDHDRGWDNHRDSHHDRSWDDDRDDRDHKKGRNY